MLSGMPPGCPSSVRPRCRLTRILIVLIHRANMDDSEQKAIHDDAISLYLVEGFDETWQNIYHVSGHC